MSVKEIFHRTPIAGKVIATAEQFTNTFAFDRVNEIFGKEAARQYDLRFLIVNLTDEGANANAFFLKRDLLVSKHQSARLKPFNLNHEERNIIGVMFDTAIADQDGNILELGKDITINSETGEFNYPDSVKKVCALAGVALFGLVAPDEVQDIVNRVEAGEKIDVSMEAWHHTWDFMLVNEATGQCKEVKRTKANRHLDNFINKTVGNERVCKLPDEESFVFGGIGRVSKGACPNSVVLAVASCIDSDNVVGDSIFRPSDIRQLEAASIEPTDEDLNPKGEDETMSAEDKNKAGVQTPPAPASPQPAQAKEDSSMAEVLKQTSGDLGEARAELKVANEKATKLQQDMEKAAENHKNEKEQLETAKTELETKNAELTKANQGYKNLMKVMTENPDLELGSDLEVVASSLAELDEAGLNKHIESLKAAKTKADEEKKEIERKATIAALGLKDDATDEDIEKARASVKAKGSEPEMPTQHRPAAPVTDEKPDGEGEGEGGEAGKETASDKGDTPNISVKSETTGKMVTV